jgi:hypothetical protein
MCEGGRGTTGDTHQCLPRGANTLTSSLKPNGSTQYSYSCGAPKRNQRDQEQKGVRYHRTRREARSCMPVVPRLGPFLAIVRNVASASGQQALCNPDTVLNMAVMYPCSGDASVSKARCEGWNLVISVIELIPTFHIRLLCDGHRHTSYFPRKCSSLHRSERVN